MTPLFLLTVLILGLCFFAFIYYLSDSRDKERQKARHGLIEKRGLVTEAAASSTEKKKEKKNKKDEYSKKLKKLANDTIDKNLSEKSVRYLLIQAGLKTSVVQYWMYAAISGGVFFAIGMIFFPQNHLAVLMMPIIGFFGFPYFILKKKVAKRQKKLLGELPDALEGMVRLLKSGMPISEAIAMTARENRGPIGEEMTKIYEAQRIGETLPEALEKLAFRVPLPEIKMFATAITIQVKTGSSLSEVLQNLSSVIRDRFKLKRKVKALSSEAKSSAAIIGALPLMVVLGMNFANPDYIRLLWTTSTGMNIIYVAAVWMGIGILVMKKMINFKI